MQALAEKGTEYTSERARLKAEVVRLERDLAGLQRSSADENRHLHATAMESQAAAERAETRYLAYLQCVSQIVTLLRAGAPSERLQSWHW